MKKVLSIVVAIAFSQSLLSQIWIQPGDAIKHKGETVNLIGFVTNVDQVITRKGGSTFIRIKTPKSKPSLTLLVRYSDRLKFKEAPEIAYLNQYIQVTGLVEMHRGSPQIVLHSEKQILIARDAAPEEE